MVNKFCCKLVLQRVKIIEMYYLERYRKSHCRALMERCKQLCVCSKCKRDGVVEFLLVGRRRKERKIFLLIMVLGIFTPSLPISFGLLSILLSGFLLPFLPLYPPSISPSLLLPSLPPCHPPSSFSPSLPPYHPPSCVPSHPSKIKIGRRQNLWSFPVILTAQHKVRLDSCVKKRCTSQGCYLLFMLTTILKRNILFPLFDCADKLFAILSNNVNLYPQSVSEVKSQTKLENCNFEELIQLIISLYFSIANTAKLSTPAIVIVKMTAAYYFCWMYCLMCRFQNCPQWASLLCQSRRSWNIVKWTQGICKYVLLKISWKSYTWWMRSMIVWWCPKSLLLLR